MTPAAKIVLDTSAYSHLRAGHAQVLECVAAARVVIVPVTVLGELDAGFELGRRALENRRNLAEFLDEPFVNVLDVTATTVRHYARIFAALPPAAAGGRRRLAIPGAFRGIEVSFRAGVLLLGPFDPPLRGRARSLFGFALRARVL